MSPHDRDTYSHATEHDASAGGVRETLLAELTPQASISPHHEAGAPPPLGALGALDAFDALDADSDGERPDSPPMPRPRRAPTHTRGGGDVVLILGLPDVFTVGYDAVSFTAKHFGGVRDVPPGPHLFWAAHPGGMATRSGSWIVSAGGRAANRVHVLKWDGASELLGDAPADEVPTDVDAFHAKLLPYRDPTAQSGSGGGSGGIGDMNETQVAENERIWGQMTNCITEDLLSRVTGQSGGTAWHINTMDHVRGEVLLSGEREMEQHISHSQATAPPPARELRFALDQHAKTYSAERFGADRTREAIDATSYLVSLLDGGAVTEASLVGELQLAFLAGVHLGNDACLAQWWHVLLRLLLQAYALPRRRPALAAAWLRAVTAQLAYGGAWLDTPLTELSEPSRGRALRLALIVYKRRLDELLSSGETAAADVAAAFARLEAVVAGPAFGWDIRGEYLRSGKVVMEDGEEVELEMEELQAEDERGEWAPEVVELDEQGREKGLISWND